MATETMVTAQDIEIALAHHWGWRGNLIVPNVSWGWHLRYEADLIVLRPSGWAIEVEIKVTAADIRRDRGKRHQHDSARIWKLYFAVPEALADCPDIPSDAGILAYGLVAGFRTVYGIKTIRPAPIRPRARKVTEPERLALAGLGAMRIWALKQHLQRVRRDVAAGAYR